MKNIKNLTILKTTNTSNSSMFPYGKKIIEKITLVSQIIPIPNYIPPTKLEILSQVKKEYEIKVKIFEEGISFYTWNYDV